MSPLVLIAAAVALGLCAFAVVVDQLRSSAPSLPAAAADLPTVAILVPCRNEEPNVVPCVEALLAQTVPATVTILDDGSTDRTAELARRHFGGDPRVRIVDVPPLPPGWRGKVHALDVGWRSTATDWVLTTDADARCAPDLLARALTAAREVGVGALSIAGRQEARGIGENLLTPAVFALLDFLLGSWEPSSRGAGPPVANGQFLLLRRDAWDAAGGFATVRMGVVDDVEIARRLHASGSRTAFFRSGSLSVRMYRGAGATFAGWRRSLGALFGGSLARLAAFALTALAPPALLALALALGRWPAAFLLWSGGVAASALLRRGSEHRPAWALLYPWDALALAATAIVGTLDHRRGRLATWKGRTLSLDDPLAGSKSSGRTDA